MTKSKNHQSNKEGKEKADHDIAGETGCKEVKKGILNTFGKWRGTVTLFGPTAPLALRNNRTSASGDTVISFPKLECWNTTTKVATVAADVDKKRVLCRISMEILRDQFGTLDDAPMQSVAQHRTVIQRGGKTAHRERGL